jgi:hypothetical protein
MISPPKAAARKSLALPLAADFPEARRRPAAGGSPPASASRCGVGCLEIDVWAKKSPCRVVRATPRKKKSLSQYDGG